MIHPIARKVRCAIYTRKSNEEGLEQDFNSLHAQRAQCQSFIESQKSEGWVGLRDYYDDGGVSGGTLNRPALKRLIDDIEEELVDVVVVHKIDRLSRSLMDFSKLVEVFDRHKVTFVSVTQSFNTTTSMGKLTLNILLSFAQFEREITGERIRDKIAASRKRGIWMGGVIPFGYRVENRKLLVRDVEAQVVCSIFERFVKLGSATKLAQELLQEGKTTRSGKPIDKGFLYKLLNNEVYLGRAVHKGESYEGEHDGIIGSDVWAKVHGILQVSPRQRAAQTRSQTPSLLKGLLFAPEGVAMSPTYTRRRGRLYRYYVSQTILKKGAGTCEVPRVPAAEIEAAVIEKLRVILRSPEIVVHTWHSVRSQESDLREVDVTEALVQLDPLWDQLHASEQARIVQLLVARIDVTPTELRIRLRANGISALANELQLPAAQQKKKSMTREIPDDGETITVCVPIKIRKFGGRKQVIAGDGDEMVSDRRPEGALVKAVARAFRWRYLLEAGVHATLSDLATAEKINPSYVSRILRITLLAPNLVYAILDGRQPDDLTLAKAMRPFPTRWNAQTKIFSN
ncbi:MAG: recombinase family protein [Nitrosospira sp.]